LLSSWAFPEPLPRDNFKAVILNGTIDAGAEKFSIILLRKSSNQGKPENLTVLRLDIGIENKKYQITIGVWKIFIYLKIYFKGRWQRGN